MQLLQQKSEEYSYEENQKIQKKVFIQKARKHIKMTLKAIFGTPWFLIYNEYSFLNRMSVAN